VYRSELARSYQNQGLALERLGRPVEALAAHERALTIRRALAAAHPAMAQIQRDLASSLGSVAMQRAAVGRPADAAALLREAIAIMERLPHLIPVWLYQLAEFHVLLAGVAPQPGSGMTPADERAEADRAMERLRQAIDAGCSEVSHIRAEPAFDQLRTRADFQALMRD
jgi:tetratricopeptide (TPR) repeat protein